MLVNTPEDIIEQRCVARDRESEGEQVHESHLGEPRTLIALLSHLSSLLAPLVTPPPSSSPLRRDLYDRRPSVLKSWSKNSVTMIGDAVHPMMPNLGQVLLLVVLGHAAVVIR